MIYRKHKKIIVWGFIILCFTSGFLYAAIYMYENSESGSNAYFFKDEIINMEYEGFILPLSGRAIEQNITLNINHLKTFENGSLYVLKLELLDVSDPWDQLSRGSDMLGYFYVTEERIYRMLNFLDKDDYEIIKEIEENEEVFLNKCDIVCSENATDKVLSEDGWYKYVEIDGERRIFYYYSDYIGGTRFYETIIWEKEKGIIYYKSGYGSMLMHIEFGIDSSYFNKSN